MRAIRVAPVALLGAAALALTAPAAIAYAATSGGASSATGFTVTPSVITPGSQVTLAARGCSTTSTAGSGVFDTVTIPRGGSVAATVDWDAKPGASYEVTFICNSPPGSTAKSGLTIAAAPGTTAAVSTVAAAGVQGGLGGSIGTMDATQIAAGTALAVVLAAGAVHVARRRRESRAH
ncbi:hypothetical protein OG978_37875 [Streptomyces sp. NBC_01591]|uniref:hypothetical protein n=1 Tax=Streptomyces sp. NBC_01591 TaxID=2975888 RepID=UPI002DDC8F3B|nr:hypothetical protein [Streptomyces sp. NBC_01591]WSD72643.1 hypothetical protein OG978_37875 [Streptomyces sp. NBC_01591]